MTKDNKKVKLDALIPLAVDSCTQSDYRSMYFDFICVPHEYLILYFSSYLIVFPVLQRKSLQRFNKASIMWFTVSNHRVWLHRN